MSNKYRIKRCWRLKVTDNDISKYYVIKLQNEDMFYYTYSDV